MDRLEIAMKDTTGPALFVHFKLLGDTLTHWLSALMGWFPEEASQMCKAWSYSTTSSQTWFFLSPPSLVFFFCIVSSLCNFRASLAAFSYDSVACFTSIQPPVFIVHAMFKFILRIYLDWEERGWSLILCPRLSCGKSFKMAKRLRDRIGLGEGSLLQNPQWWFSTWDFWAKGGQ